jgi:ACS family hexuronate transporter-like MFS transporter
MHPSAPVRSSSWKWQVCGLLLLATMINYMDRLTLNQNADRIMKAFDEDEEWYGLLETVFAVAFAVVALAAGWMVDRWNVWWLYPTAVFFWSLAGFATGLVETAAALFMCRFFLGLAESGHWPCALRTTQRLLPADQRTLGNSILQSGAALGSIVTPLLVLLLLDWYDSWRPSFLVVGALGLVWVCLWLTIVRRRDLVPVPHADIPASAGHTSFLAIFGDRRFWILGLVVACINCSWHFFRAWLPLILKRVHNYEETEINLFTSLYYLSTDAGALTAGFATLWLARKGMSVHGSRLLVFFLCALLPPLSLLTTILPTGPGLLLVFLVIGFGALGVFPAYYSFTQELTVKHQGKVTGTLGFISWSSMAPVHWAVGKLVKETGSYDLGLAIVGFAPLLGFLAVYFFWEAKQTEPATAGPEQETRTHAMIPADSVQDSATNR